MDDDAKSLVDNALTLLDSSASIGTDGPRMSEDHKKFQEKYDRQAGVVTDKSHQMLLKGSRKKNKLLNNINQLIRKVEAMPLKRAMSKQDKIKGKLEEERNKLDLEIGAVVTESPEFRGLQAAEQRLKSALPVELVPESAFSEATRIWACNLIYDQATN